MNVVRGAADFGVDLVDFDAERGVLRGFHERGTPGVAADAGYQWDVCEPITGEPVAQVTMDPDTATMSSRGDNADAIEACYDRADVFVLATLLETYGMAVAEALVHGLPVVSTATLESLPAGSIRASRAPWMMHERWTRTKRAGSSEASRSCSVCSLSQLRGPLTSSM